MMQEEKKPLDEQLQWAVIQLYHKLICSDLLRGGQLYMVNMQVGGTLGPESRAPEPQSHQTLYIPAKFACRDLAGPPPRRATLASCN